MPQLLETDPRLKESPVNTELFKKIYETIAQDGVVDSSKFDMDTWECNLIHSASCGTTRCVAGWAIHFASGGSRLYSGDLSSPQPVVDLADRHDVLSASGVVDFDRLGADLLGLDRDEKSLFYVDEERALQFVRLAAQGDRTGARAVLGL
jgi:hypothetical protein